MLCFFAFSPPHSKRHHCFERGGDQKHVLKKLLRTIKSRKWFCRGVDGLLAVKQNAIDTAHVAGVDHAVTVDVAVALIHAVVS